MATLTTLYELSVSMSGISSHVRNLMQNIRNGVEVENKLLQLKTSLIGLNSNQLSELARETQLNFIFDCLNSSDQDQIETTCYVLKLLLPSLSAAHLLSTYETQMVRALSHPEEGVKKLVLKELTRCVGSDALMSMIKEQPELLKSMMLCLCDEDITVGTHAIEFLTELGKSKNGLHSVCQPANIRDLIKSIGDNNTYAIRVFQVMIEIAVSSKEALNYLENEGLLDRLSYYFNSDDVLSMLALLEVCTKLAVTEYGYEFLSRHGIFENVIEQLVAYNESDMASLTYPGLTKFFGSIAKVFPKKLINDFPEILRCAFKAVDEQDLSICVPSLELLGFIAYSPQGKAVLQREDEKHMRHAMGKMSDAIIKLPNEYRTRALHALANIIHAERVSVEVVRMSETWFNQLGTSSLTHIVEMAKQPFNDLKEAAYIVLLNMANQRWGQYKMFMFPGLMDYLMDRSTETDLEGHYIKYNVLRTIADSDTADSVFEPMLYESIVEFARQGPVYAPRVNEVAIEGAE